ncbi:hypothetical protein HDU97_004952 [Phlyctochytrium planicorne]|nr:hypothetical protein HDU97_004952 [Phlyctochytrium planicorne]
MVGMASKKYVFYVAGGSSILTIAVGVGAISVCVTLGSIQLFARAKLGVGFDSGFITMILSFLMFLIAGGVALAQSRRAPSPDYPRDSNTNPALVAGSPHGPSTHLSPIQVKPYQQPSQYQGHGPIA